MNPLCGDEVTITIAFGEDGDTIEDVKFSGRGCAISQSATSMLTELIKGRKASDVAALPKEDLLRKSGAADARPSQVRDPRPLDAQVALHKGKGTPCPTSGRRTTISSC